MSTPSSKHVLLVFAHQDQRSFGGSLKSLTIETLEAQGHSMEVSDLYSQHFEPRATKNDFRGPISTEDAFNYAEECRQSNNTGTQSLDIKSEMDKLRRADLVIFQFPLYWSSVPAILKGWFDRVLSDSFAFDFETQNILERGFMKGKKAILSLTTGCTRDMLSPKGLSGDINVLLRHIQYGTLRMCGFDVLPPQFSYATKMVDQSTREQYLKDWKQRLKTIFTEEPLSLPKLSDFDSETMMLHEGNGKPSISSIEHRQNID